MSRDVEMFAAAALAGLCSQPAAFAVDGDHKATAKAIAARAREIGEAMAESFAGGVEPQRFGVEATGRLTMEDVEGAFRRMLAEHLEEMATRPGA